MEHNTPNPTPNPNQVATTFAETQNSVLIESKSMQARLGRTLTLALNPIANAHPHPKRNPPSPCLVRVRVRVLISNPNPNPTQARLGRTNYVTPTNYLELVKGYCKLLKEKRATVGDQAAKLRNGLTKLSDTATQVSEMSVELEHKKKVVAKF